MSVFSLSKDPHHGSLFFFSSFQNRHIQIPVPLKMSTWFLVKKSRKQPRPSVPMLAGFLYFHLQPTLEASWVTTSLPYRFFGIGIPGSKHRSGKMKRKDKHGTWGWGGLVLVGWVGDIFCCLGSVSITVVVCDDPFIFFVYVWWLTFWDELWTFKNAICFCLCIWGFPFGFRFHPNSLALSACLAWPVWVLGSPKGRGAKCVCFFWRFDILFSYLRQCCR